MAASSRPTAHAMASCIVALQLLALMVSPGGAVFLKTRILDAAVDAATQAPQPLPIKVGDGIGRPLYQFNTIQVPTNQSGEVCISLRLDKATHAFNVDSGDHDANSIAYGCYHDQIDKTGWSTLEVSTTDDEDVPLVLKAYGAGIVEGLLTATRISQFHNNVKDLLVKDTGGGVSFMAVDRVIRMALVAWEEFSGGDAGSEPEGDIPKQAWAALLQLRGIRDGNNLMSSQDGVDNLSAYQVMLMNMHAEIPSVVELYGRSMQADVLSARTAQATHNKEPFPRWGAHQPHGTAIVAREGSLGHPSDLLSGHVTFGDYGEMLRVTKTYHLHFGTLNNDVTMSSYPGCVSSTDDYFITGMGFVAMSVNMWLPSTGEYSHPPPTNEGLPSFLRAIMATRIATQPRLWAKVYAYINGVAGAKQWLIVDYNKFKTGQTLADDTVWMVESLSRVQRANDVSHVLREGGFFEAHGVPHFHDIREIYGLPGEGPGTYEESRQSALLDKGATISNLDNARQVLTESKTSRTGQLPITARDDLDPTKPIPSGGIDAKVTSMCLVQKLALQAKSSPPLTPGGKAFSWLDDGIETFPGWPHSGLPDEWNFAWYNVLPGKLSSITDDSATCDTSSTLTES